MQIILRRHDPGKAHAPPVHANGHDDQDRTDVCKIMIFDKMAKMIEQHVPELKSFVAQSKLFYLDIKPHEALSKAPATMNFFLPFRTVAIEDKASVVILHDTQRNQRGLGGVRFFIEFIPEGASFENFDPNLVTEAAEYYKHMPGAMLNIGILSNIVSISKTKFQGEGSLLELFAFKNGELLRTLSSMPSEHMEFATKHATTNAMIAMQEIMLLNNLENKFILEEKPIKPKIKKGMIARSHQRPKYTILEPKTIRKRTGLKATGKALEEGYERRRHYRTYQDDRYVKMKGKTVIINATWVGPSEAIIGKRYYKVRLDL